MADNQPKSGRLARSVGLPVRRFMELESAGGLALLAATVLALAWANSPWRSGYDTLWDTAVVLEAGPLHFDGTLHTVVNDALMALFFFVVGLEIKRELVTGELQDPRSVGLPVLGALGGMVAPAAIYGAFNAGGAGSAGWGIPMATDIAFALGVVVLLGDRVPPALKVFLLTLAIADDIGAILVIAVFYSGGLSWGWLGAAAGGLVGIAGLRRLRVSYLPVYMVAGTAVWYATHESGVHATIAGVALGLMTPVAVGERLENVLHPWTSFLIVPIFALANAGVPFNPETVGDALASPVGLGILFGLVAGKILGVTAASWLAVRLGIGRLPDDVAWSQLAAVAALAGIGFTVSLFVAGLAFDDQDLRESATVAVLVASMAAALLGAAACAASGRRTGAR